MPCNVGMATGGTVWGPQALPAGEPIDLATCCFAAGTSPDRLAALDALNELARWAPSRSAFCRAARKHPSPPSLLTKTCT